MQAVEPFVKIGLELTHVEAVKPFIAVLARWPRQLSVSTAKLDWWAYLKEESSNFPID